MTVLKSELADPRPSAVIGYGRKWIGLSWSNVDAELILTVTPHKTAATTDVRVVVDLNLCPMILEEIDRVPKKARRGPMIVDERTALPYNGMVFTNYCKREIRPAAGIPAGVWNRDIRAGGIMRAAARAPSSPTPPSSPATSGSRRPPGSTIATSSRRRAASSATASSPGTTEERDRERRERAGPESGGK
jgi:hypothetical protein